MYGSGPILPGNPATLGASAPAMTRQVRQALGARQAVSTGTQATPTHTENPATTIQSQVRETAVLQLRAHNRVIQRAKLAAQTQARTADVAADRAGLDSGFASTIPTDERPRAAEPHLNMKYCNELQAVADRLETVIIIRDPNFKGQTLLDEGHATKSSHIKAKSSETGPTSGFVAVEPRYTKLSQAEGKQAAAINASFAQGCKAQQIFLSPARVAEMTSNDNPDMVITASALRSHPSNAQRIVGGHLRCSAQYPHRGEVHFELRFNDHEDAFAVYEVGTPNHALLEPKPVLGLTNPLPPGATATRFDAVCADYDLFAVHAPLAKRNPDAMRRYIDVPSRSFDSFSPAEREAKNESDARARHIPEKQDPHLLNANSLLRDAILEINREVMLAGGPHDVCHHSDEIGNPNSDHPGFPQFAFYPRSAENAFSTDFPRGNPGEAVKLKDWDDLKRFNAASTVAGFYPPPNNERWGEVLLDTIGKVPGIDEDLLIADSVDDIVLNSQPGSFERFQLVLRALEDVERSIGENTIIKKPSALKLTDEEARGRAVYCERVRGEIQRLGGLDDLGRLQPLLPDPKTLPKSKWEFSKETLDKIGPDVLKDLPRVSYESLKTIAKRCAKEDYPLVIAYMEKAFKADKVATQLLTIANTTSALLGAVEGLERDAPAGKPLAAGLGRALMGRMDNAIALLLEKSDSLASGKAETDVDSLRAAKEAVVELGKLHAKVRADLRSIEEDVTSMVGDGYVLTTEKHADARAGRALRKEVLNGMLKVGRLKRQNATTSVNAAWNAAHALAYRAEGRFAIQPRNNKESEIIRKIDELRGAALGGAALALSSQASAKNNEDADNMMRDLRLGILRDLETALNALGMEVPDRLFDEEGEPVDEHKTAQFLQEIDALRGVVVARQRPTRSLDLLVAGSHARENRHIQRSDHIAKANTLLASLGLTRGILNENELTAAATAKGRFSPDVLRSRLKLAQELARADARAMQPDQRDIDFDAETESSLRSHWSKHVAHVVRSIEDENLLGVKEHPDETANKPTWVGRALGKKTPALSEAQLTQNKEVQLICALVKARRRTSAAIGLHRELPTKTVEILQKDVRPNAQLDREERAITRAARKLIDITGKRSMAGRVRRTLQKAYASTIKPPDAEARWRGHLPNTGVGTNAGINISNGVQTTQGDATLPFGGIIEGSVAHIAFATADAVKLSKSYKDLTPNGLQRADQAVREQTALGQEMVQRFEEKNGPEDQMRSRVLLHLGEKIQGKADPTSARKIDKGGRFGMTALGLLGGVGIVQSLTVGSAMRTAGAVVPPALPLVGYAGVGTAAVSASIATARQGYEATRNSVYARRNNEALQLANDRVVKGMSPPVSNTRQPTGPGGGQATAEVGLNDVASQGTTASDRIEDQAVEIAHHRLGKLNRPNRAGVKTADLAAQSLAFGGSTTMLYTFAGIGTAVAATSLSAGGVFGGIAAYFSASFAFRTGLQARRDATRDALTDYLKDVADSRQIGRLNKKAGIETAGAEPGSLKSDVVAEILKREPELVTDLLLAALRRELPPLTSEEMEQQVSRHAERDALKATAGPGDAENPDSELSAKQRQIDEAAAARLMQSKSACFVIGLGADPEHVLAIADSYQTKAMDAFCRELLNFTILKVARLDTRLKDGAYPGTQ